MGRWENDFLRSQSNDFFWSYLKVNQWMLSFARFFRGLCRKVGSQSFQVLIKLSIGKVYKHYIIQYNIKKDSILPQMLPTKPHQSQEQSPSLQPPPFDKTNTLLSRPTPPSHKIVNLTKKQQNIQLIFIVLSKQPQIRTKKDTIVQCLIADETASIFMNFFNETAGLVEEGDIVYASGIYLSYYRDMLLLYQGGMSIVKRVGRQFFRFQMGRNMSLESLQVKDSEKQADQQGGYKKY